MSSSIDELTFDNRFVRELPADPSEASGVRQVTEACYSFVKPTPVAAPSLVAASQEMCDELGLDPSEPKFAEVFSGNTLTRDMQPFAACYGGHQFGNWAGQLGDGRAIALGEVKGATHNWELQLKGAGPTPYSRGADGRAVLRSSVREFLCSEAMFHLGVATTRALSLVRTGDQVVRDMLYDGNPAPESGAIVCRAAPSFIRFGNFQIFAARGDKTTLEALLRFTLRHHFPALERELVEESLTLNEAISEFFEQVCRRSARMVADWMRFGFVHGVMNTDNMSILGLTIDYGPYGWLEDFDPGWTPNTTDAQGRRYRYGAQPEVAAWNLAQLAHALSLLVEAADTTSEAARESQLRAFEPGMRSYWQAFDGHQREDFAAKLGLEALERGTGPEDPSSDLALVNDLLELLAAAETDMTLFYRGLARLSLHKGEAARRREWLVSVMYTPADLDTPAETTGSAPGEIQTLGEAWEHWFARYIERLGRETRDVAQRRQAMDTVNPKYVLRNYLAQMAIDKADQGDDSMILELLDTLRRPFDEQPQREAWSAKRPEWARHKVGCSMLSCSS